MSFILSVFGSRDSNKIDRNKELALLPPRLSLCINEISGNSSLKDAEVFFITDYHTDEKQNLARQELITYLFSEYDYILCEGTHSLQPIDQSQHRYTSLIEDKKFVVLGADCQNLRNEYLKTKEQLEKVTVNGRVKKENSNLIKKLETEAHRVVLNDRNEVFKETINSLLTKIDKGERKSNLIEVEIDKLKFQKNMLVNEYDQLPDAELKLKENLLVKIFRLDQRIHQYALEMKTSDQPPKIILISGTLHTKEQGFLDSFKDRKFVRISMREFDQFKFSEEVNEEHKKYAQGVEKMTQKTAYQNYLNGQRVSHIPEFNCPCEKKH